ncbi:MAG: hypothetical protein C0478_11295 [Planctomyces sp.]|nr:hypothetical protein [Planctomyces sp.]
MGRAVATPGQPFSFFMGRLRAPMNRIDQWGFVGLNGPFSDLGERKSAVWWTGRTLFVVV